MLKNRFALGAVILACAGSGLTSTQTRVFAADAANENATLVAGSIAPPIFADKWVKGAPVKTFERGRVYVVEFWATWCNPCIASVPHLTELQKKYPNITIIGVAASEQPTRSNLDDRLSKVENFVTKQGTGMNYTVAYDGAGAMWSNWMVPAQRGGIPATFIVGPDGRISWIGHPLLDEFDRELEAVVSRPDVRADPSNWQKVAVKPVQSTIPAPVVAAKPPVTKPTSVATTQPAARPPRATKPTSTGKKLATGPKNDDASPK